MAGEKQEKEVRKTVLPVLARPAATEAALFSATPTSTNLLGKTLANSDRYKDDLRSASTT